MKLLENVALVQFFLYEALDLETGLNTAFLGPNGTGKSALLDAIQLVVLAADRNRMHFNAAGEGKKQSRSLRDYCLGSFIPGGNQLKRQSSNTYVDLCFRDLETDVPFTAGVSLSASADSAAADLNGLYILPGVSLTAGFHVEREGGRDVVLAWRQFMHKASDLCREAGTTAWFSQNREEFTRRLLIDHLAGAGDTPNARALRSCFARSMKLGEEITDLSETLRVHLIESMPSGVKDFRARLDDVRALRDLIRRLKVRIDRASETIDKYGVVKTQRTNEANLEATKHVYATERLGEGVSAAEDQLHELASALEKAQLALGRAHIEVEQAREARDRAIADLHRNPDYARQRDENQSFAQAETTLKERHAALARQFKAMLEALLTAGRLAGMDDHRRTFEEAVAQVDALERSRETGQVPPAEAVHSALLAVAQAHSLVRRALALAEDEQRQTAARVRDARTARERASRGLVELREPTLALMNALAESGIEATPVCDLVTITDPDWQPIVESYLGPHIEALLVPAARELEAIDLYRGLRGARAIYGVKLALPSRLRDWNVPGPGNYAAQLVRGADRDAARYLQGELGRTELAESSAQLRAGVKALSKEGMVSSGGGIERRRLPGAAELKLGRGDNDARRKKAENDFLLAEQAERAACTTAEQLASTEKRLAPFADAKALQETIEAEFAGLRQAMGVVDELRTALVATQTDALSLVQERKLATDQRSQAAEDHVLTLSREAARLEERSKATMQQREVLVAQREVADAQERASKTHALYDANEADRHRQRLDERHGDDWLEKLAAVDRAIQIARSTAINADRDAWTLCSNYLSDYHLKNNDLVSDNWLGVLSYMLNDRQRLVDLELAEQEARAEEAYAAAVRVFRTDVAQALLTGFDRVNEQIEGLNAVLKAAPEFSNGERYLFRSHVLDQHKALHEFLLRVREHSGAEDDMFGAGALPEEFRAIVEGEANAALLQDSSPLHDHRRFFAYDIEVFHDGTSMGLLSKRFGQASGGEHRTPVYLIFGAALAAAYGKAKGGTQGGGLMLLDEAFEKMDPQNVRSAVRFLNGLGLQLIMAGPESDQAKLSSFLSIYYDMSRFGSRTVQFSKTIVHESARQLLQSDNFHAHPDLLAQEIARLEAERVAG